MIRQPSACALLLIFTIFCQPLVAGGDKRVTMISGAPAHAPSVSQGNLPSAKQVLDKHLRLTGGSGIRNFVLTGLITGTDQGNIRVESYKDGERQLTKVFFPSGQQHIEFYDGNSGWRKESGDDVIDLGGDSGEEPESLGLYANFVFLLNAKGDFFGDYEALKVTGLTKVNASDAYVLEGRIKGGGIDKYYFDKQVGVLLRSENFDESNKMTTEVIWSNYRNVGGKQVPHKVQVREGQRAFSVEISEIMINTKIDPTLFEKPEN